MRFKQLFEADETDSSEMNIKDVFKVKTKHPLNKFAKLTVYGVLKKHVKSEDLGKVAEKLASRKFDLAEGTHSIDDAISDIPVSKEFFKEIYNKKKDKNMNMMGPGELMLWAIYSNVNFNPTAGDLLIDGKVVEVKAARGQFGGDPKKGWKSWSDAKEKVKKVADDLDIDTKDLDKNRSLVQANLPSLFSIIKDTLDSKNGKEIFDLATALVNNESAAIFTKQLEKSLKKAKDANDAWLMMLAVHSQIYQAKYKFEYIIKFNSVNRKFPHTVTVVNPNAHSIESLVEFFKSNNIRPEEWAVSRSGGMAAK
jgi:hypothetical protein